MQTGYDVFARKFKIVNMASSRLSSSESESMTSDISLDLSCQDYSFDEPEDPGETSDQQQHFQDLFGCGAYMFEPSASSNSEAEGEEDETSPPAMRVGNTDW